MVEVHGFPRDVLAAVEALEGTVSVSELLCAGETDSSAVFDGGDVPSLRGAPKTELSGAPYGSLDRLSGHVSVAGGALTFSGG